MMSILSLVLQVALGVFSHDPKLSAGNLCGYLPQDTLVSAPPKGYKPFYISHAARHGSRFLSHSDSTTFFVADTLAKYAEKGLLTADGYALMDDIRRLKAMSDGNYGRLTEAGANEHRQISARMYRHYPEVFNNRKRPEIAAYSTDSKRVQESMHAFTDELTGRSPALTVDHTVITHEQRASSREVTGNHLHGSAADRAKKDERTYYGTVEELRKDYDLQTFAKRFFTDPQAIPSKSLVYMAKACFKCQKTDLSMGRWFTPEELYYFWLSSTLYWAKYVNFHDYTSPITCARGGGMIEQIIEDADNAINSRSRAAATLRFTHDTYMLPLMAAVGFESTVLECTEREIPEHFQDYNFVCPACNVQLIFYRRGCCGPVLVKLLLNEKESLIHGLAPVKGCYYDWQSLKNFWQARIESFNNRYTYLK